MFPFLHTLFMSTQSNKGRFDFIDQKQNNKPDKIRNFNSNPDLSSQKSLDMKIASVVFTMSIGYATLRYNVIKGIPWTDWPLYVLNKAFAVSSIVLLLISVFRYRYRQKYSNAEIVNFAGISGFMHIIISLTLLNPTYYDKFFLNGKLSIPVGISILLGAVASALFVNKGFFKDLSKSPYAKIRIPAILAFIIGLHTALQGYQGWVTPSAWPGYLPPITLISFLIGLFALVLTFGLKHKKIKSLI